MAQSLPTAWLNGEFLALEDCRISPLDRGFLFADGVYELIPAYNGKLFRLEQHLDRLDYSLGEIVMQNPLSHDEWRDVLAGIVSLNGGKDQAVYLQVTRGADTGRDHRFPDQAIKQTVFVMSSRLPRPSKTFLENGIALKKLDDTRWARCDIKSVSILANVLLRQSAEAAGCQEALLIRDGRAIEGSASTLFAVIDDAIVTPSKTNEVLPGITRDLIVELAGKNGYTVREASISLDDIARASEVWLSSSTRELSPVTRIDDDIVGDGKPGPVWKKLFDLLQQYKAYYDA
ncbi:MAG: D-amino acid aminotransferase [Gammaproteobacteria bacterium]